MTNQKFNPHEGSPWGVHVFIGLTDRAQVRNVLQEHGWPQSNRSEKSSSCMGDFLIVTKLELPIQLVSLAPPEASCN